MGRVLTIQIEIVDKEDAAWIWYTHMHNKPMHGVIVQAIHEGKMKDIENDRD